MREYFYNLATDKINGIIPCFFKFIFLVFSFLYGIVVKMILSLYKAGILKRYQLDCKVISVGNITWGGTGKTPLTELIAKSLAERNIKVAVLTRGYKRELSKENKSDEAVMLSQNLLNVPVIVGKNRIKSARSAIKDYKVDVVVLDDGFQQWKIQKDLEIVAIDSTNPFGNKRLIPLGILREPLSSLARADMFVATKTDFGQDNLVKIKFLLNRIKPDFLLVDTIHEPVSFFKIENKKEVSLKAFTNKNVCLLASIADPEVFEKTILKFRVRPKLRFYFLDHYQYKNEDIEKIIRSCKENQIDTIITTEKDIPRINETKVEFPEGIDVFALRIGIKFIKNEEIFFKRLYSVCNR